MSELTLTEMKELRDNQLRLAGIHMKLAEEYKLQVELLNTAIIAKEKEVSIKKE